MTIDLGSDFEAPGELRPDLRLMTSDADKARAFLQGQARALNMPRGTLWYSRNRGLNVSEFVADSIDPRIAQQQITDELLKDERCARCTTTITVSPLGAWTIQSDMTAIDGTKYQLVFIATEDSASLLLSTQVTS